MYVGEQTHSSLLLLIDTPTCTTITAYYYYAKIDFEITAHIGADKRFYGGQVNMDEKFIGPTILR